jgi:hypothetical protein
MNKGRERLFGDGGLDFVKPGYDRSGLVGEGEALAQVGPEGLPDVLREALRHPGLGLEGPGEEAALHRFLDHVLPGQDPDAPPRQLMPQIGHDLVVGPEDEADQLRRRVDRAGNDAGALRFMPRHWD